MTPEVDFHLHDPSTGEARTLLDVLVEAASGADRGGGIFAFASCTGIDMLLGDEELRPLVSEKGFELVVGVDSVTDVRALERLAQLSGSRTALMARVLVHDRGGIFHPKLCWFVHGDRLRLVVGSGNLTIGGLARNTEAFVATELSGGEASAAKAEIQVWLERWGDRLLSPDAAEARAAAAGNSGSERSLRRRMKREDEESVAGDVPPAALEAEVLALDVSKNVAHSRTQLEVGKEKSETYFGSTSGRPHRVLIQPSATSCSGPASRGMARPTRS
jgi:HKD family nuclease